MAIGSPPRTVLGLSGGLHDSAAALLVDGRIAAAVEEERLSRRKHDPAFPAQAADCCLAIAGLEAHDIDVVAYHEKPLDVISRHLSSRLRAGPSAIPALVTTTPVVLRDQLAVGHSIDKWFRRRGSRTPVTVVAEHHVSHAAAAFYPSPFRSAAVLTVDGVGEWATTSIGEGRGRRLDLLEEVRFPDSIGLLYSAFTAYCGFRVNGGEGELMGLAPFGDATHAETIRRHLVDVDDDGSFRLDGKFFAYHRGRRTTSRHFHRLFGGPPRPLGSQPTQREADLAASVQVVIEDILLGLASRAHRLTEQSDLVISGGVALNCVANGRLRRESPFRDVWVQPASGDAGNALGAALWAWHGPLGNPRALGEGDTMQGAYLGPQFTSSEVGAWLDSQGIEHRQIVDADLRCAEVARRLAAGEIVGWFCGRMEFGPRALGHRSILADPRSPTVQARLNALVKERATFRPFAPAVLAERAAEYFDDARPAPYMTTTTVVRAAHRVAVPDHRETDLEARVAQVRSSLPAVTHVDHSARVQTVDAGQQPEFHQMISAFRDETGCPVLLNTSFNARDEPIVCTPADALATFRRIGLDLLVMEDHLVEAM